MEKSNTSQEQKILAYLKSGRSLTPLAALRLFGSFRLGARIFDLRRAGHNIVNLGETRDGKTYARYKLVVDKKK